jgi:hypothetical protein
MVYKGQPLNAQLAFGFCSCSLDPPHTKSLLTVSDRATMSAFVVLDALYLSLLFHALAKLQVVDVHLPHSTLFSIYF